MFNKPLSFNGRIGRLEYLISFLIFWIFAIGLTVLVNQENSNILSLTKLIVSYSFLAQGAKRCHDIGRSGWFQLIPFYFIWMIIAKGHEEKHCATIYEENSIKSKSDLSNPISDLLFGILGIVLLFFTIAVILGFIKAENKSTIILSGLLFGGVFLASSIRNNIRRNIRNKITVNSETAKENNFTASELIEKYKSNQML